MTDNQAFIAGYFNGRRTGKAQSPRQVMEEHPTLTRGQADIFLNGQDDGIRGDTFRMRLREGK